MSMRRPRSFLCAFVIVGSLVRAVASHAQPAPSSGAGASAPATDDADRLFREANELYKQKKFAEAEAAYEKAFAKKPAHDIAANLGYAEMNQNKLVEAAEHLSYAVRIWPPTGKDDKRQGAMDRLAKVKAEIATLTIDVSVSGAHVLVGDRDVGTSPLAAEVFAEPGKIVVRAKREGYVDAERSLDAAKGSAQTVTIAMVTIPTSAPSVTATASATPTVEVPQRSLVPAVLLGGAAVIAAGVGIGLDVDAASRDAEAKQISQDILASKHSCVAGAANFDARCAALAKSTDAAQLQSLVGVGLLAGAGVLAAGAALYWLFPRPAPLKVSLSVRPSTSQPAGMIGVSGSF